jgi:general secretion pathway protein B
MSILLDALKKSERRERLGQVPGLAVEAAPSRPADAGGGALRYVLVIVPVLLAIGWLTWQQYRPLGESLPGDDPGRPATTQADESVVVEPAPAPGSAAEDSAVAGSAQAARTPVEDLPPDAAGQAGQPGGSGPASSESDDAGEAEQVAAQDLPSRRSTPSDRTALSEPKSANAVTRKESEPAAAGKEPESTAARPRDRSPAETEGGNVISYWELPASVRNQLPPLGVSVLVYSEVPDDRFALVDGRRLGQGDDAGSGVRVMMIRRDGVVFRHGAYRFLVKP